MNTIKPRVTIFFNYFYGAFALIHLYGAVRTYAAFQPYGSSHILVSWLLFGVFIYTVALIMNNKGYFNFAILLFIFEQTFHQVILVLYHGVNLGFQSYYFICPVLIFLTTFRLYIKIFTIILIFIFYCILVSYGINHSPILNPDLDIIKEANITNAANIFLALSLIAYVYKKSVDSSESSLKKEREKADAANQAKTQFVSSVSHEFKTPLNAVIGISEMLIEDAKAQGNKSLDEPLTRVHRAGEHLLSLINELLDISKIEAGKVDIQLKLFSVSELIKDITATVKPMVDTNHNTFEVQYLTEQESMRSDEKRVTQILLNLLSNAAKFTENGNITLNLKSSNEGNTNYLLFDVIDTGTGIPEDKIDHVFDEYSQVKSSKQSKYSSTGLGLGISRKLARVMGGDIIVTSKYGEGSTFTAKLPVEVEGDEVQSHKIF